MKMTNNSIFYRAKAITIASLLTISSNAFSGELNAVLDDFTDTSKNNLGIARLSINDTTAGGKTTTEIKVAEGVIQVKGDIVPPRGQPGWSSLVLPLGHMNEAKDASNFNGIELKVKLNSGNLSVSANSTEVTNFDYHAAPIMVNADGNFHLVKIPFESMKRMWSKQTKLNKQSLNSVSIVAFSPGRSAFNFELDEIRFY